MTKNTSINIGDHFDKFIACQVSEGRFGSKSEVIRAGLRLLEDEENKIAALRAALEAGERSGFSDNYSIDSIINQLDNEK